MLNSLKSQFWMTNLSHFRNTCPMLMKVVCIDHMHGPDIYGGRMRLNMECTHAWLGCGEQEDGGVEWVESSFQRVAMAEQDEEWWE